MDLIIIETFNFTQPGISEFAYQPRKNFLRTMSEEVRGTPEVHQRSSQQG